MKPDAAKQQQRRAIMGALAAGVLGFPVRWAAAKEGQFVPPEVLAELPQARLSGHGVLRFFGLKVYAISAWVEAPIDTAWWTRPLALEITYARSLSGPEIAKRSLKEMQRQAAVDPAQGERWLAWMRQAFPDVREGDRILGVSKPGGVTRFYVNGQLGKSVSDPEFQRLFFGIWLAPQTSEPALRAALLGAPT